MQPLGLATDTEAGLVHMLDCCRGHVVAHGLGKTFEALGTVLTDPGDGRRDQRHAEEVGHQGGQTLLGEQLIVQQIQHEGADPLAVLHRGAHPVGEGRPCLCAAGCAAAAVRTVFSDYQRRRFREIEHLSRDMTGRHGHGQRLVARCAGRRVMIDDDIGGFGSTQGLARVTLLPPGLLAGRFTQAADAGRLLQPVA